MRQSDRSTRRPGWRRKWNRVPSEKRRTAAATLGDLFERRHAGTLLPVMLAASLLLHGATVPFLIRAKGSAAGEVAASEDTYLRKVIEKDRAKAVSKDLTTTATMPPPPDDPEAFVSRTMADSLTSDIKNVIGPMLDVTVTSAITDKISSTLADELKAAAKKISDERLSEKEIKAIQEDFREKAHKVALDSLKEYRIETQVKRAAISTTEWYDEKVSRVLFTNLRYEMYGRPSWNVGPRLWYSTWAGGNGTPAWHGLGSLDVVARKLEYMERTVKGFLPVEHDDRDKTKETADAQGRKFAKDTSGRNIAVIHQAWPGPGLEQAQYIKEGLYNLYNRSRGGYKNQETIPSWNDYIYSGPYCYGVVDEFYPHQEKEFRTLTTELDALWKQTFEHLNAYVDLAEQGEDAEAMKVPQQAFFKSFNETLALARKLFPDGRVQSACNTINRFVLIDLLRNSELQKQHHERWCQLMVETLSPMIRLYAEGQFREGIIKFDGSVEEALKKFPEQMLPLLRRDVVKLLPRPTWNAVIFYPYQYYSAITGEHAPPSDDDYKRAMEAKDAAVKQYPQLKAYADRRRELLADHFAKAVENTVQVIRQHVFARGLLTRGIDALAEGVDYSDKVQEKLDARKAAKDGRGQDLARLNADGLPDTGARLVALQYGLAHGGLVEPVECPQQPGFFTDTSPGSALRHTMPRNPPPPAKWGVTTQAEMVPPFECPAFEAIPFLTRFPRLDGDLSDWGKIRPLILHPYYKGSRARKPIVLYAAWNYQGFFFGYKVDMPADDFFYPEQYRTKADKRASWAGGSYTGRVATVREEGCDWMNRGDHIRLLFDTLDARTPTRGDPHTQEFVVIPMGSDTDPTIPGYERIIASKRDAQVTEWRRIVSSGKMFLRQPPPEHGPDGTGPYRVARLDDKTDLSRQSYTVEMFIPRSLFHVPIFAPGWYIGFDAAVATGPQGAGFNGQCWSSREDAIPGSEGPGVSPQKWGDLLLLGTDPYLVVQDATPESPRTEGIIPGRSYLLTVVDPDRNIYATEKDSILVSAEIAGKDQDIEVFMLLETEANSGIFRGYINSQPGTGRQVQGVLEVMPGQEVRFGYVDIGNAHGQRNMVFELRLPVIAPLSSVIAAGPAR